jgi:hypothetical protein
MVIERHRRRDVCVIHSYDQDVKGGVIGAAEKARWHSDDAQVVIPVCCTELDLRPWHAYLVEHDAHPAGRLRQRVAPPLEIGAHRPVVLVHPGGKARDAGGGVHDLHRIQSLGALGGPGGRVF